MKRRLHHRKLLVRTNRSRFAELLAYALAVLVLAMGMAVASERADAELVALQAAAKDRAREVGARIAALNSLVDTSDDISAETALSLLTDDNEQVAGAAARALVELLSRIEAPQALGQGTATTAAEAERSQSLKARVADALRQALWNDRKSVRMTSAEAMASRNDLRSLTLVHQGVSQNLYSQLEAVRLFGLASREIASKYLRWYLEHGSDEAKVAAIPLLATDPSNRTLLREMYRNPQVPTSVRDAVARVLNE